MKNSATSFWNLSANALCQQLHAGPKVLTEAEARRRLVPTRVNAERCATGEGLEDRQLFWFTLFADQEESVGEYQFG